MLKTFDFLKLVLDSVSDHLVVLDRTGRIVFTNKAWDTFGRDNECPNADAWLGVNYIEICRQAGRMGDESGGQAAEGICRVIDCRESFHFEYPCHGPAEKRWFMMSATSLEYAGETFLVISHRDITKRKLAEESALELSRRDGLTGIFNRRHFDQFVRDEWRRCARLGQPISAAMIDIDHFKLLNDTYGHRHGDDCLIRVAGTLGKYAKRPGDICARYGGEEFVMVFGNSGLAQVLPLLENLLDDIRALRIPNEKSPTHALLTVSIGLATMHPPVRGEENELLKKADALLYAAKKGGRNRIVCADHGNPCRPDGS